ncbi:MAG: hypothetical protein MJ216_02900 [Bacilli bacterium]|nr:hypothetical protein [Bacilli bacterium]
MSEEKKETSKKPKSTARKIIEWVLTGLFLAIFAILGFAQIDGMVHKNDHYGQTLKFGYGTFVVETDSMVGAYNVGSAIVTHLDDPETIYKDFQKGKDVDVTFFDVYSAVTAYTSPVENTQLTTRTSPANYPITHRVKEIHINEDLKKGEGRYTFIVSGINQKSTNLGWQEGQPPITINQYQAFTEKQLLGRVVIGSAFLGGVFGFVSSVWGLLILLLIPAFFLIITSVIDIFKAYKDPEEAPAGNTPKKGEAGETKANSGVTELSEADKKRLKEQLLEEMLSKKKGDGK